MNTYEVTVKVQSLNFSKTVVIDAEDTNHAQMVAMGECLMPNGQRSGLRLRGAHVDYDVREVR